ncbi:NAD(P)-dependent oxidoreductase [Aureimonas fodinaquatilis]|uniref:NAD(P)-dependent oxidoreductase n=1 Tax=Aureimonas fodinaquatilis TaxID=2565783 RepID=A0A5B0DXY3_9HYPH|nr:NAD(P)-dependent oxidoreductase [Aureimonas fodinaquatilis]KAA0971634.1 NAD(P)-dependent oxidoreductase [Aureimonas fodinaquatilis]
MRALITGATGFLGGALARHLAGSGWSVVALGRRPAQVETLITEACDDTARLYEALDQVRPDVVFHLAGAATGSPDEMERVNVGFAAALLNAARQMRHVPKIVLAGTAAEYGEVSPLVMPVEEHHICAPVNAYGRTKLRQTELGLEAFAAGIPVFLPRLFNIVGPDMGAHLSLGRFARSIVDLGPRGGRLVTGPLQAERDFVAVGDVVETLVTLTNQPDSAGQIVNFCSGNSVSIGYMLDLLIDASGAPVSTMIDPAIGGVNAVNVMIGCNKRAAAMGVALPVPDYTAEMARLMESALQVTEQPAVLKTGTR